MAAGDLALMMLIGAEDMASAVVLSVSSALDTLIASIDAVSASFAALDSASSSVDATLSSIDAVASSASASLASIDTAAASADASLATLDASASGVDASLATLDASAASVGGYLDSLGNQAFTTGVGFDGLSAASSGVDASLASVDAAAASADASLSSIDGAASSADASFASVDAALSSLEAALASITASASGAAAALEEVATAASTAAGELEGAAAGEDAAGAAANAALGPIVLIGAALVGLGMGLGEAVHAAGDFQSGMTSLVTGAGEAESAIGQVSQGILHMSVDTGTSTEQLTSGMYMIESAGYHGAEGLQVLQTAAEGAKVGNADLGVVSNALTTILTDYHLKATDAASAMNALVTTVASGKTHMQDLANSMGSVLPLASSLGISFPQVAGAIATMTNAGMSAQRASMNLANAIRSLAAPGATAQKALKDVGISTQELNNVLTHQGLQATLQMIEEDVGKKFPAGSSAWTAAMKAIMGGATGLNVALMLGGKNMAAYETNIKAISGSLHAGGSAVQGWSKVQQDFNFKMDKAKAALGVLGITIGTALLPAVGKIASAITPIVTGFANWLASGNRLQNTLQTIGNAIGAVVTTGAKMVSFFQQNQVAADALLIPLGMLSAVLVQMAVTAIVAFIASVPALVAGFIAWATAAGAAAIATIAATWPILAIGAAVGLVIAGIVLAIQHWGQIAHWLQGVWSAVAGFFVGLWNGITSGVSGLVTTVINFFTHLWDKLVGHSIIPDMVNGILKWFSDLVKKSITFITDLVTQIITWILNLSIKVLTLIAKFVTQFCALILKLEVQVLNTITQMVAVFLSWLDKMTGGSVSKAQALVQQITGILGNLGTLAMKWGQNLMQGFINGIGSMLGSLGNTMHNVVNFIGSFLPHSPAKQGELSHLDEYGPNLVRGIAQGITKSTPLLQSSMNALFKPVGSAFSVNGTSFALARPTSSNQPQTMNMQILLDGREITHAVGVRMANEMRIQGAVRSR